MMPMRIQPVQGCFALVEILGEGVVGNTDVGNFQFSMEIGSEIILNDNRLYSIVGGFSCNKRFFV